MAMQPFPRPLADRLRQLEEDRGTEYPDGYELIYSSRRTLAVQITAAGQVRVRAPRRTSRASIDRFLIEKEAWVLKYLTRAFSIREQKTRWGSCSSKGNLNFNWRLIFAPEEVLDYIVVHELAHRREMNHSQAFYDIVESVLPEYKKEQKWLREHGESLWTAV